MDIREAMMALQQQRGAGGNPGLMGAGVNPLAGLNPYGALQPGAGMAQATAMPAPVQPDYNAILQQQMINKQAEMAQGGRLNAGMGLSGMAPGMGADVQAQMLQALAARLGDRTGGALQFDPSQGWQGMRQQFRDWRQEGNRPVGFGQGQRQGGFGMADAGGGMQPQNVGPPTQPVGVATPPGGGVQSALGAGWGQKKPRLGGGGTGNMDTAAY